MRYFGIDICLTDLQQIMYGYYFVIYEQFLHVFQNEKTRASPAIKLITNADFSGKVTVFVRTASNF